MEGTSSPRPEVGLEGREQGKEEKRSGEEGMGKGAKGTKARTQKPRERERWRR